MEGGASPCVQLLRLLFESSPFHQPDPGQVLDPTHDLRLKDMLRTKQARSEIRSMNQQTMLQCLERGMSTSLLLVR